MRGETMKVKTLFQNDDHTVGIIKSPSREKMRRILGYFNKEYLEELTKLFELFGRRDMSLYVVENEGGSMLLLCPDDEKDIYLCVTGKGDVDE